ncbi:unnamed protein product [Rotaria sp. Silwood1]|nr:unnamed protein product [Rotaria sp. Silwood1]
MIRSRLFDCIKLSKKYYSNNIYNLIFSRKPSTINIDIDGIRHRINIPHSLTVAQLRKELFERYCIADHTRFLDDEGSRLHTKDEESTTIKELLTKNNLIRLASKSNLVSMSNTRNNLFGRKTNMNYNRLLRGSTNFSTNQFNITSTHTENDIILPTSIDITVWEKIFQNCDILQGIILDQQSPKRAFRSILKFKASDQTFPLFKIKDDSYIRAYINDKQMDISFLSSNFFENNTQLSNPYISFGINTQYSRNSNASSIQTKTYLTRCLNFPRVILKVDLSYLELTPEFNEQINDILSTEAKDEQIDKLKKLFSVYGHVYPRLITLGSQLYHIEEYHTRQEAEQAKKSINMNISIWSLIFQSSKLNTNIESNQQTEKKTSMQTSLREFQAIGGDTRWSHDPHRWINTIVKPSLWRIIEQEEYESIIQLLDPEREKKLKDIIDQYLWRETLSANFKKKEQKYKETITENNHSKNESIQLSYPTAIFIDEDKNIRICDVENNRTIKWESNENSKQTILHENQGIQSNEPPNIIIEKKDNSFIISDYKNNRKITWSPQNNLKKQTNINDVHTLTKQNGDNNFIRDCPNGRVNKQKYAFDTCDHTHNGTIAFSDLLWIIAATRGSDLHQRLFDIFDTYDLSQDGQIDQNELTSLITALYGVNGVTDQSGPNNPKTRAAGIIAAFDLNANSKLSREEFITACTNDSYIRQVLSKHA